MTDFKYNRLLIGCIIVGLVAALAIGWQRHTVEENNSRVELVMDYEDVVGLAQMEGVPVRTLMDQYKEAGLTSLAVYETTLEKLHKSGKVTALPGAQILHQYRSGSLLDPDWRSLVASGIIRADDVYITARDQSTLAEVKDDLIHRLGSERVSETAAGGQTVLAVKANYEKVIKMNLGLSSEEMKEVGGAGYYVVVRPSNYIQVRPEDVNAVFDRTQGIANLSTIVFSGDEILGYPGLIPLTNQRMKEQGLTFGVIEHPLQLQFFKQEGLAELATLSGYNVARLYVIPKDEQPKLKLAEAVHRWVLTDQERNIRINLLRSYEKPAPGKTLLATNLEYVSSVARELKAASFTLGRAGAYQAYFPPPYLLVLAVFGAAAAGVLFCTLIRPFRPRYQYLLLLVLTVLLSVPVLKGGGTLVRQAAALVCASVFPALTMTWFLDRWRRFRPRPQSSLAKIIVHGAGGLTLAVLLSLAGGLYVGALLADVRFLLEMEIFRGVKLTFVAPVILITIAYLARFDLFSSGESCGARGIVRQVLKILDYPVYVKTLIGCALVAVVAWVFVGRSGHTAGVPVPGIELKFRAFLEDTMYARPREKEFMIGHPAFMLWVMGLYRQWPRVAHFILVVLATIGQGSLVETFAHIRTPIFMSMIRGLDGLAVGVAFGIILIVGVQILHYLSYVMGRRSAADE